MDESLPILYSINSWDGQAGDYRETHPEWILTYPVQNGKYNAIMNPALPEVRQRLQI